jgi:hypothetical protein
MSEVGLFLFGHLDHKKDKKGKWDQSVDVLSFERQEIHIQVLPRRWLRHVLMSYLQLRRRWSREDPFLSVLCGVEFNHDPIIEVFFKLEHIGIGHTHRCFGKGIVMVYQGDVVVNRVEAHLAHPLRV